MYHIFKLEFFELVFYQIEHAQKLTENDNFVAFLQFWQMLIESDHFGAQKDLIDFSVKAIFSRQVNETLFR